MGYEKLGSDQSQLAGFGGGVVSEDGTVLITGESTGSQSLLFGAAALREIQSNVANGDFSITPPDPLATISDDNPIPYWTGAQTGTAPTVSAAITASALSASGGALTFTVAAGAATGSAYTITRYVPIAGNANRSSAYHPEVYVATVSGGGTDKTRVRLTLTATAIDADYSALTVTETANATASTLPVGSLFTDWMIPDKTAAYVLVSIKVDVPATAPVAAVTFVISEVRLGRSESSIAFPSVVAAGAEPWIMQNNNGTLEIYRQASGDPLIQMISDASSGVYDINLEAADANGVITLSGNGYTSIYGGFVDIEASGGNNVNLQPGGGGTVMGGAASIANGLGVTGNIDATGSIAAGSLVQALGVFRSIQASTTSNAFTARTNADANPRFAVDCAGGVEWGSGGTRDTNLYRAAANLLQTDDNFQVASQLRVVAPTGTTQTSSQAIYFFVSGNGSYELRRNTSSARYKTNIEDADAVVLEAARRIKPRHYESTIAEEEGATRLGFIAEEIHDSGLTHAVGYDSEGKPETIDPTALIAALWHRVNDLEQRLEDLEGA